MTLVRAAVALVRLTSLLEIRNDLAHDKMPRKKPSPKKTTLSKRPGRPRASKIDHWDVTRLKTSPDSRLVDTDLVKLLANPDTWSHFTKEDLEEIGAKFPEHVPRNEDGSILTHWLRYDNDWRNGVRQWQEDLGAGRLDPEWQKQAAAAVAERAAGDLDKYKEDEFEEFWGQKQKMPRKPPSDSAALKLADLITANLFRKGDYWVYSKSRFQGKNRIEIVKNCKIEEIGDDTLTFAIPLGTRRHARKSNKDNSQEAGGQDEEDVERYTTPTVGLFENRIVEIDGRSKNDSKTNAWKAIHWQRDNQDLGTLFEAREKYYVSNHSR